MSALLDASPQSGPSDAWFALVQALAVLAAVGAFAWLLWRTRQQMAAFKGSQNLRIEARLPLDLKNTLWIVDVEGRRLLLGTAEGAPPQLLSELSKATLTEVAP